MTNIYEYLANNEYPGRGIIVGRKDGKRLIAYFIMGRSANSRNRVFAKKEEILFTKAYDESKVKDPSLIIYNAVRPFKEKTIVTNGDQTDTIYEYLAKGYTFADALDSREYEPDAPNYTPRISALIDDDEYDIAILKREEEECHRVYYHFNAKDDIAHFISTYDHNGDPLPSFSSNPIRLKIEEDAKDFAEKLWASLNNDNKISLYVCHGQKEYIFNKNEGD
ncbi:MAG: IMP cyclohydrolase [Erysipelotrichaceae bacterium]|nr:IMP cyclohydrolase [Erysipelotrichaceae bacterium]MBQ9157944.1 IMP cyclohydrolase [Erysipelotrichaceae bacterium]